jgi:hypothetical protein
MYKQNNFFKKELSSWVNPIIKRGKEKFGFFFTMPKAQKRNSDHAQRHNTPTINK